VPGLPLSGCAPGGAAVVVQVADFGLSKLGKNALQEETANPGHISTRVKGTLGASPQPPLRTPLPSSPSWGAPFVSRMLSPIGPFTADVPPVVT